MKYRHIKKSTRKPLIDNISKRLLELEFNSFKSTNHSIITNALKKVVKKVLPSL